jgi:rsbT co-antagonist protein RsbR
MASKLRTTDLLRSNRDAIVAEWLKELDATGATADSRSSAGEVRAQAERLVELIVNAGANGETNVNAVAWGPVRDYLDQISTARAKFGYTSSQTATFVFSFRKPLFTLLRKEIREPENLADEMWAASDLVDRLGLYTVQSFQRTREDLISRQQHELLELSTPVVKLWDGVLALPMIGTLDSARTQVVMESLLQRIVETASEIAIIDITGVPTVDTLVAQHLLKTVTAIRLMGADCIISGVRPQIAQTIVHLGVDLQGVTTKATLADALALALARTGRTVTKAKSA